MKLVGVVKKDKKNTQQNYNFRGIDDMYNALNEHLSVEGIFITSKVIDTKREERPSKSGGVLLYSILTMEFEFFAEDGSSVKSVTVGEAMDSGDKSMNKAMSTAYKYALMQIFCIPTEEEKDTEYQTHEVVRKSAQGTYAGTPADLAQGASSALLTSPTASEKTNNLEVFCGVCKAQMVEKSGTKDGKTWSGYFCPNSTKEVQHPPRWI